MVSFSLAKVEFPFYLSLEWTRFHLIIYEQTFVHVIISQLYCGLGGLHGQKLECFVRDGEEVPNKTHQSPGKSPHYWP